MGVWSDLTGALDHAAGSTDEAVARSFDDEPGGGLWSGTAGWFDHAAGSMDESVARSFDDEPGGGLLDGALDTGADILIDHPGDPAHDAWDIPGPSTAEVLDDTAEESVDLLQDGAGAVGDAADATNDALLSGLMDNPVLLGLVLVVAAAAVGNLADVQMGGSQ